MASVELVGWSIIESGTYIVTACLPHMKPILSHYTPQSVKKLARSFFSKASTAMSGNTRNYNHTKRSTAHRDKNEDEIELAGPVRLQSPEGKAWHWRGEGAAAAQHHERNASDRSGRSWLGDESPAAASSPNHSTTAVSPAAVQASDTLRAGPGDIVVTREVVLTSDVSSPQERAQHEGRGGF